MKAKKVITIITVILLVAIISIASFGGIYKKKDYKVVNVVPDYILGMEFTDSRVINLEVDKSSEIIIYDKDGNKVTEKKDGVEYTTENGYTTVENKKNSDEVLTVDNYKKTKTILKKRLKGLGVDQYRVTLDETTGNIQIRIPENDNTDIVIYNLLQSGTLQLKDSETEEVLIDTNSVKKAKLVYSQGETQTGVYLQVKLNKEGTQKLEEISKIYVGTSSESSNEEEKTEETKNVAVYLNEVAVTETYFGQPITDGTLNIIIGQASDSATLEQYIEVGEEAETILNSGVLPISYTETDSVEASRITSQQIQIGVYVMIGIVVLMTIIFVIGLRTKGIFASILQIGYIALLLLALRYTNVKITLEGIAGIALGSIINFVYIYKAFKNIELNFVKDITAKFAIKLIPVYVIAIILSFNRIANIYSLGMVLVWSIITMYIYNLIITQITLKALRK